MFSVFNRQYYFGQICSKNQNCQIKLKFVILTISNIQNLIVIFITLFLFFMCTFYLKNLFSVVNGGGRRNGGLVLKWRDGKFLKSLYIYTAYTRSLFLKICPTSHSSVTFNPHSHSLSLFCRIFLTE